MTNAELRLMNRLRRQVASMEPSIAQAILDAYARIANSLSDAEVERILSSGAWSQLFDPNGPLADQVLVEHFDRVKQEIRDGVAQSATTTLRDIKGLPTGFRFNSLNPMIVEAIRTLETRVMQSLTQGVRNTVRQHVEAGIQAGINPRKMAKGLRDVIPLGPQHEQWVRNFRAELEAGSRAALNRSIKRNVITTPDGSLQTVVGHAGGKGLRKSDVQLLEKDLGTKQIDAAKIDRMVEAYRQRLVNFNAETTARTAAIDAQKLGGKMGWRDAIDRGFVDAAILYERWVTAHDDRVRDEHAAMDGEEKPFNGIWSNGETIPGDSTYNCRCVAIPFVKRKPA